MPRGKNFTYRPAAKGTLANLFRGLLRVMFIFYHLKNGPRAVFFLSACAKRFVKIHPQKIYSAAKWLSKCSDPRCTGFRLSISTATTNSATTGVTRSSWYKYNFIRITTINQFPNSKTTETAFLLATFIRNRCPRYRCWFRWCFWWAWRCYAWWSIR